MMSRAVHASIIRRWGCGQFSGKGTRGCANLRQSATLDTAGRVQRSLPRRALRAARAPL